MTHRCTTASDKAHEEEPFSNKPNSCSENKEKFNVLLTVHLNII